MPELMNVEDATEVVVGRTYLVNAVYTNPSQVPWYGARIPVLGPAHNDIEVIGFPYNHWHADWRFVSHAMLGHVEQYIRKDAKTYRKNSPLRHVYKNHFLGIPVLVENSGEVALAQQWDTCDHALFDETIPWVSAMEAAHKDKIMKCNTCPHRGFNLTGAPEFKPGVVVCPGHGLAWDRETGALVPRA